MTGIVREVTIGPCRLIHGDCYEVLPLLGKVDAVVTDPPYGVEKHLPKTTYGRDENASRSRLAQSRDWGYLDWDSEPPTQDLMNKIVSISDSAIVWGGNYFSFHPSACWLVWDKQNGSNDFADCELAWTNLKKAVRRIQHLWHGMIRKDREERFHPTQKPVGVMTWCIGHLPDDAENILDPFMGSGTTGVAAIKTGKQFIGVEREPKYFDIAVSRIRRAWQDKCSEIKFEEPTPLRQMELVEA